MCTLSQLSRTERARTCRLQGGPMAFSSRKFSIAPSQIYRQLAGQMLGVSQSDHGFYEGSQPFHH